MENKKTRNNLIGIWLIIGCVSIVFGFITSKMDRLQWLPLGGMNNFYYVLTLALSVLIYITIDIIFETKFATLIATLLVSIILLAMICGIVFPECADSWTGDRPPCEFNINLASIIGGIGSCVLGMLIGSRLLSKD
ncbi:hypothetical protein LZQ00_06485 [Sphingobacterium sp. SRCM116780]|uniref:hypothetical protein n=1 Tax=Sphingobacterium sp. SRCM116780 TaxID=2907623 RepID=UPI001F15F14E|nr:hypothetical protein [Sphingobacterium sp. SRCM116780]UIR57461.1 hypothetical protein LZQ00_06485 [Sphingobacterium sp. SRCM116780]